MKTTRIYYKNENYKNEEGANTRIYKKNYKKVSSKSVMLVILVVIVQKLQEFAQFGLQEPIWVLQEF